MKERMGICFALAAFLALGFLGFHHSEATPQLMTVAAEYVPNEVLVKFKTATTEIAVIQAIDAVQGSIVAHRGEVVSAGLWAENKSEYRSFLGDSNLFEIKLPPTSGIEKAITELMSNSSVELAEKNYVRRADTLPNDPSFSLQWGLNNTTQTGGTDDADIDAPEAWEILTGSPDIIVAVNDTGIDYDHIDLQANIWTNPGETGGGKETDGIDNDGNGFIDDWHGWDFYNSDNDPMDDNYDGHHGTHVAGVIGADGNNSEGVAGVCWSVKLMPLKTHGYYANGYASMNVAAIDYAISMGAKVINMCFGGTGYSSAEYQAIERAMASGALVVAAAGNASNNNNLVPHYPSSYDLDNIIAVLWTNQWDMLSSSSNYGPYTVDLGAPGGTDSTQNSYNILSTNVDDQYDYFWATSAATPFISGGAALLLQQRPTIDWWQAKTIILKSGNPKSTLNGKARTNRRFNLNNALNYATPILPNAPTNLEGTIYENGGLYDTMLTWTDNSAIESGFKIYMQTSQNVFAALASTGANVTTFWLNEVGAGTYHFYVLAYGEDGESTKTPNVTVHIN